jgi:Protein of unknown function (DUF2934)
MLALYSDRVNPPVLWGSARAAIMERETRIRRRAYELYLERGQDPGFDLDDWLQAENEIRAIITKGLAQEVR